MSNKTQRPQSSLLSKVGSAELSAAGIEKPGSKTQEPVRTTQEPVVYTPAERPIIDQLKVIMPQTAKSTIEEGRLWSELRAAVKKT